MYLQSCFQSAKWLLRGGLGTKKIRQLPAPLREESSAGWIEDLAEAQHLQVRLQYLLAYMKHRLLVADVMPCP